jgi:ribonuclease P protein component
MQRRFRLRASSDIRRVRQSGKSFAHPLLVLIAARTPGEGGPDGRRIAVTAGGRLGGAVERNRAKRRLREAVRPLLPALAEGWDLLLVARSGALSAPLPDLAGAVRSLCRRAGVLSQDGEP